MALTVAGVVLATRGVKDSEPRQDRDGISPELAQDFFFGLVRISLVLGILVFAPGDYGTVPGPVIPCSWCRLSVEVFGTEENAVKRGVVMLRNDCPFDEDNYYSA
ncbi:hypothetical protein [Natronohydrobacter thiooxidans]|uniref:hypothetical protein n=1 Tax=Natronohydrobacter thiooxidans TaxID=87172 RepID=UPI000ABA0307|nr:hypothetical protein [Natronohydrobacter thiooxidans]